MATSTPASTVIFAIGNESRGDDALGPLLLRELDSWLKAEEGRREKGEGNKGEEKREKGEEFLEQFELIEEFQLQIEHAMDIKDRKRVLFIDAGMDTPSPFHFYRLQASDQPVLYSHALTPAALLTVYVQFYHEPPPDAFVLCIKGDFFELGEPLSANACENLTLALDFAKQRLLEPESSAWDIAISQR
jgi:hydrogenase maturation protease